MINYYGVVGDDIAKVDQAAANWVSVEEPTNEELAQVAVRTGIHVDELRATMDTHENPRAAWLDPTDDEPGIIVLRYPAAHENQMGYREYITCPMTIIIMPKMVVTLGQYELPEHVLHPVKAPGKVTGQPEGLVLRIMWGVLNSFVRSMDHINVEVDTMQADLGGASRNSQLYEIMAMQKSLIYFEAVLDNTEPILAELQNGERYFATSSYDARLAAVKVEAHQARTMTRVTERVLEQYNTTVSSIVSNNLNIIMKVLTSITIILTIPTVIGGMWGMNVPVPFTTAPWAFWGISGGTAVVCGAAAWWLWRHDYF